MYPQSMFCAKIRKILNFSSENEHFHSREILLFIAWACLRNGYPPACVVPKLTNMQ